jgi:AcrR family transcriptional regulator
MIRTPCGNDRYYRGMPVKAGAALDPDATRARVLDVAARLFYERSLSSVGIREVASASSASQLTIYRYFGSKEGLAAAVARERSDRVHAWLQRRLDGVPAGPDRVITLFDLLIDWFGERGFRGCAVVNYATDNRGGGTEHEITRGHLTRYRALLERLLAEAGISDPAPLARQLLLLIEGVTVVSLIDGDAAAGADARAAAQALLAAARNAGPV